MELWEVAALLAAGIGAGAINAVVGSGTLITFPTLLALGFPPVLANVSNNVGLVPGSASGAWAYRRELSGQRARVMRLAGCSVAGVIIGAILLLELPASAFDAIVPVLIILAVVLVIVGPRLNRMIAARRSEDAPSHGGVAVLAATFFCGIYGGYFGAAQGILLMAFLGILLDDQMQRLNAVKNVLAGLVNLIAAIVFIVSTEVAWDVVAVIAVGSTIGGQLGGMYGRRLPPNVLRGVIVVVGTTAAARLLVT